MDEMINQCAQFVDEFNKGSEVKMTKEEAIANMKQFFPMLKRWKQWRGWATVSFLRGILWRNGNRTSSPRITRINTNSYNLLVNKVLKKKIFSVRLCVALWWVKLRALILRYKESVLIRGEPKNGSFSEQASIRTVYSAGCRFSHATAYEHVALGFNPCAEAYL